MKLRIALASMAAASLLVSAPAIADSKKDIQTISKAVSFMTGGPKGDVDMAVVYDPSNADSAAHADEIVGISGSGVGSKVKLKGKKVSVSALSGDSSPVIFLTRGSNAAYSTAISKVSGGKGITVSTDESCLGSGCVLAVKTQPSVDIMVSTAAADSAGVSFASAFSMMITKR